MSKRDLDEIVTSAEADFRQWSAARLYVTGGTGFFGQWLLRAFRHANQTLGTHIRLDVLTRDPAGFCERNGDLAADSNIRFIRGDVVAPVVDGTYDGVIHAAATSGTALVPRETLRTIVDGTQAVIRDVIAPSGAIPVLFISSGAVYGRAPRNRGGIPEGFCGEVDHLDVRYAYHESKRLAELSFAIAQEDLAAIPKIARLFAFLGPSLPLDTHFAAGNFIRDALAGGPIRLNSAGNSVRTYLYPTDMIVWCLAILNRGLGGRAYNVGSDEAVSIRELAYRIGSAVDPNASVIESTNRSAPETRYVPDVRRVITELGVRRSVDLDEAIARTIKHHRDTTLRSWPVGGAEPAHS